MPTAKGTWKFSSDENKSNRKHRNHHYTFDVNHNGIDINGFILHHDKHDGKKHKKRIYLDSNENGRFDKDDLFIGRTGIKDKHTKKGVGELLDPGDIGHVEVLFRRKRVNASLKSFDGSSDIRDAFVASDDISHALDLLKIRFYSSCGCVACDCDEIANAPLSPLLL